MASMALWCHCDCVNLEGDCHPPPLRDALQQHLRKQDSIDQANALSIERKERTQYAQYPIESNALIDQASVEPGHGSATQEELMGQADR